MTAVERTAYPRLKLRLIQSELEETFTPTPDELSYVATATKGDKGLTPPFYSHINPYGTFDLDMQKQFPLLAG